MIYKNKFNNNSIIINFKRKYNENNKNFNDLVNMAIKK